MHYSRLQTYIKPCALLAFLALAAPAVAWAASDLGEILNLIFTLIRGLTVFVFSLAVVIFFWGIVKFILNAANSEGHREGINFMIWGVISIFVMASIWGLVGILQNTFSLDNDTNDIKVPQLQVGSSGG